MLNMFENAVQFGNVYLNSSWLSNIIPNNLFLFWQMCVLRLSK